MISKVNIANPNFKADLWTYPHTCTDQSINQGFRQLTSDFPNYTLVQDDISFHDKDFFILFRKDKNKSVARGWYNFTSNPPKTKDAVIERFVAIFKDLIKRR